MPPFKELPGFYYDPEKNRYFRLLPGHNNCNPLTKESIQQKAMESTRLRLLEEEEKQNKVRSEIDCNYPLCSVSTDDELKSLDFLTVIQSHKLSEEAKISFC